LGRPPSKFSLAHRSGLGRVNRPTKAEMDGAWRGKSEWIRRRSTGKKERRRQGREGATQTKECNQAGRGVHQKLVGAEG